MRQSARPSRAARAGALLALGALAVHELRYLVAYGGDAPQAMASQGHGYLGELTPAVVVLALSAILGRLATAALGRHVQPGERHSIWLSTWTFAAALGSIFAAQELVEGAAFSGHPGGAAALLAGGGWLALPLSLGIGLLAALADRLLAATEGALLARSRRRRPSLPRPSAVRGPRPGRTLFTPVAAPLAFGLARRPPPVPRAL